MAHSCLILCLSKATAGKKVLAAKLLNMGDHHHGIWLSASINGVILTNLMLRYDQNITIPNFVTVALVADTGIATTIVRGT